MTISRWWWYEAHDLKKYLIPNTCGWIQKTRPYQDDDDMKRMTSKIPNTCGWMQKTRPYQNDDDMKHKASKNT